MSDADTGTPQMRERRLQSLQNEDFAEADTVRVNYRAPKPLIEEIDALVEAGYYFNRSEALRDGLRRVVFTEFGGDLND